MLKNYLKIAWRTLTGNKVHTTINIVGLSIGITAALLIYTVVQYELSYDKFQKNYDRIYRVVTNSTHADGSKDYNPGVPVPAFDALKTDFPQFEKIIALNASTGNQVTVLGKEATNDPALSKKFIETGNIIFTQPEYFDMFTVRWIEGTQAALNDPRNIVLNRSSAEKYFGNVKLAFNQYLKLDNAVTFRVAGIVEDVAPNSDFPVKLYASYEALKRNGDVFNYYPEWGSLSSNHQVYVLLPAHVKASGIQSLLNSFSDKNYGRNGRTKRTQVLQPLSEMHFDAQYGTMGDHSTSKTILWTLALIGVLIIVMASINFINLATAQAVGRSKEVGIRKVLGSSRPQLILQVMGETFLIVLCSLVAAVLLAWMATPWLSNVASVPENIPLFNANSLLLLLVLLVAVTVLSGMYPSMIVSGFTPALALKSKINSASIGGISLRRILVVTQFAISQVLIIGTIVAVSQMNFIRTTDLGFNKEALWILPAYSDSLNLARIKPLKSELLKNPNVISVSFASDEASSDNNSASNFAFDNRKDDEAYPVFHKFGDADYFKTFGLKLVAGRGYTESDTLKEMVINERLAGKLGLTNPQDAIGKTFRIGDGPWLPIVGVVKDFKTNSLREDVKPLALGSRADATYTLAIKMRTNNIAQTTSQLQKLWEKSYPEFAFNAHFSDETIEQFYRQETQLALLYKIFAGIAIFISCLGLYGLVSYMAVQKTKEVGIRKVLGAGISNIVYLFSKEFTLLICIAFLIAVPLGWYLMNSWLQNFVYRVDIGIWVFALAIISSLLIAWVTVGYRAIRAALANPVKSLRTE